MPPSRRARLLLLAALIAVSLLGATSHGQQADSVEFTRLDVGFGGTYKIGFWAPIRVEIAANGTSVRGRVEITIADGEGIPAIFSTDEVVAIPAGETRTVVRYVKYGRAAGGVTVALRADEQVVARREWNSSVLAGSLTSDKEWVLTLGSDFGVRDALADAEVTTVADLSQLPTEWYGYEGVDSICVATSDLRGMTSLTTKQRASLKKWVTLGGRLFFCAGANSAEVFAEDSFFTDLAPGNFSRVMTLRSLPSLETYASSSEALDSIRVDGEDVGLQISLLENTRGQVEAFESSAEGRRPVIIKATHGLGQVLFAGVALDQAPFSVWEGRGRLIDKLLHGEQLMKEYSGVREATGQLVHLGYKDLTGQLRNALDQFADVKLVAFSWVAGLIVVYVLLIGPTDYFVLKRVVGRMQWTWATFSLTAILFCVLAVLLRDQFKAAHTRVNQLDIIDVDAETGLIRGTTWAHLYSPVTDDFDVGLSTPNWQEPTGGNLVSWQGLPGTGLGGLRSRSATIFSSPYTVETTDTNTAVAGIPVQTGGTRALSARWWREQPIESTTKLYTTSGGLLRGDIANPLPFTLSDCMVLYDNWAIRLERKGGVLRPGDSAKLDIERGINLSWRLTRRQVVEVRDVTTPWDPQNLDVGRIVEMMMFFKAAGSEDYTRLSHRYQPYVDVSEHLQLGRAVLFGRTAAPTTTMTLDGEAADDEYDERWTFCRVVFPVDESAMLGKR